MSESNKNRRDFIKQSATAVASIAAFPSVASAEPSSMANANIRIGFIGPGGRGFRAHVRTLCKLQNEGQPIELVAVCDVYNKHRERAAQYIEQYPNDFDAAVLSSPMMELLTTHPFKVHESVAYPLAKFLTSIGQGEAYALDMEEPDVLIDYTSKENFEAEFLTKSWKRWTTYNEVIEQNQHLIAGGPGATWGITNKFGKEAYEASFKARSAIEAAKIVIPVLMFQSGEDYIVGEKGQNTFEANAVNSPYFETVVFEDAYHETYMERDEIHDEVVARTKAFFDAN